MTALPFELHGALVAAFAPGADSVRRYEELRERILAAIEAERTKLNTPEINDFATGVLREAAHQRERWGDQHDAEKTDEEWFWLFGYLAGKALHSAKAGDHEKAMHHTITAAAAMANWHAKIRARGGKTP